MFDAELSKMECKLCELEDKIRKSQQENFELFDKNEKYKKELLNREHIIF